MKTEEIFENGDYEDDKYIIPNFAFQDFTKRSQKIYFFINFFYFLLFLEVYCLFLIVKKTKH